MQADLFKALVAIRSSYWFIPGMMALAAILLGGVMVWVDVRVGSDWLSHHLGWYQSIKPSGARDVLSTIAGSMITVAGVVFSITMVAISFASAQYGPRLLTNFMSDRGNKITLGTFIATFLYCLVVLRTVRGGDEGTFVPQLAVFVGILLALCSIGVLIYFIHHVPLSIHVNHVIAGVGRQLMAGIDERFPSRIGEPARGQGVPDGRTEVRLPDEPPCPVKARRSGYIQSIEEEPLLQAASKHDLLVRLRYRPGDFVAEGRPLLDAWPAGAASDEVRDTLSGSFAIGDERTPYGDLHFLIKELVEMAGRALSTGVNDPMTAVTCMDWMGAALGELAGRDLPDPVRTDKDGRARVIAHPDAFDGFVEASLGQMRQYAGRDAIAARHLLRTLGIVAASCRSEQQIRSLETERHKLTGIAMEQLNGASRDSVEQLSLKLKALLSLGPGLIDERQADWLGGSA